MTFDPTTTTDTDVRDFVAELQGTPKRELAMPYQQAVGGEEYTINGATKEMMIRQIVGYAIRQIGEYEDDGKMTPASLVINRFDSTDGGCSWCGEACDQAELPQGCWDDPARIAYDEDPEDDMVKNLF